MWLLLIFGTECHGLEVNVPASCSWGLWFKSRPGDWVSWQVICGFSQSLQASPLNFGHDCFLPHTFNFIIHLSPWSCIVKNHWESVIKYSTNYLLLLPVIHGCCWLLHARTTVVAHGKVGHTWQSMAWVKGEQTVARGMEVACRNS
jgi:hypothetical protein